MNEQFISLVDKIIDGLQKDVNAVNVQEITYAVG